MNPFISLFLLAALCAPAAAMAAQPAAYKAKPVTASPLFSPVLFGKKKTDDAPEQYAVKDEATFSSLTKPFDIMLSNQPDLEFVINLPKDWQVDTDSGLPAGDDLSQILFGDVAKIKSPMIGTSQAVVTMNAIDIEHEIKAGHWLRNYIVSSGFSPDGEIVFDGDKRATGAFFYTTDGLSFFTTMAAQISGNKIVTARFDVPVGMKDYIGFLQKRSIDSFKLLYPSQAQTEEQKNFSMADAIKFSYPVSWETASANIKDLNRLNLRLNNRDAAKLLQGTIQVTAVRRTRSSKLMDEMANVAKFFDGLGFKIQKMTASTDIAAASRFALKRHETYLIEKEGQNPQELHVVALGDLNWYVIALLVTPTDVSNYYMWARNTYTFEQMIKSIK